MERTLFSCLYGSHLFGTNTPNSDRDEKHIVLPALDAILIGNSPKTRVEKTNNAANTRNSRDDVDREFIPVQVFARDFVEGQTYALELAFAVDGTHAEQRTDDDFKAFCGELRTRFLTRNIRAMMGYAVNRANLYSFKGERLNALHGMQTALDVAARAFPAAEALGDIADAPAFETLAGQFPKYFRRDEYDIGAERFRGCFVLLEKTLPFTTTISHAREMLATIEKKYGSRAEAASTTHVDWKAFMHALRIVDQGTELLQTRALMFPRPVAQAQRYLQVRAGALDIETLRDELTQRLEHLKQLERDCALPDSDASLRTEFIAWLTPWIRRFYALPA